MFDLVTNVCMIVSVFSKVKKDLASRVSIHPVGLFVDSIKQVFVGSFVWGRRAC